MPKGSERNRFMECEERERESDTVWEWDIFWPVFCS